jgi:hypothetical protein
MKSLLLFISLISLNISAQSRYINTQTKVLTCYVRPNNAAVAALKNVNEKARRQCQNPTLVKVKTHIIPDTNTCGAVIVRAGYLCR